MKKMDQLKGLKPLRNFTDRSREFAKHHLSEPSLLFEGHPRYMCALLAVLYEELQDRPDLQELVMECTWMGYRMDSALRRYKGENIGRLPE